jgi:hypothetical protein
MEWFFDYVYGWSGVVGITIVACIIVGLIFPQFRLYAAAVGAGALAMAGVYAKGQRDRAEIERRRKEQAVAKAQKDYDTIEKRPDKPSDVQKRMKRGDF